MVAVGVRWIAGLACSLTLLSLLATKPPPAPAGEGVSVAEQIAHAREAVRRGQQGLEKLQKRLDDPASEYAKAEAAFQKQDEKLKSAKQLVARLRTEGKAEEAAKAEATIPMIQEEWQLAKDRFDLAIRDRKLTREAMADLRVRVARDQELLDRLEGKTPPPGAGDTKHAGGGETPPPAKGAQPTGGAADPVAVIPGVPGVAEKLSATPASTASSKQTADAGSSSADDADPMVRKAREDLAVRRAELRDAEARAKLAGGRVRAMERSIRNAEQILQTERESVDQAQKMAARLSEILRTRPPADAAERQALTEELTDAQRRMAESGDRAKRISERLGPLKEDLKEIQEENDAANKAVGEARAAAEAADANLASLLSPMNSRNILRWVSKHGLNLLAILSGMVFLHLAVRQFSRHIVRLVTRNSHRGSEEDRENRASTLVGVLRYAAAIGIFGGGLVMLLDEAGVPVVPLMGGAAVLGLAVAFGAQNLIRDYFTGFMMLMEDQYSVNDVVRIGTISGLVEQITLRVTVLRDLEGVRHVIPHGAVTGVSNLTHGWSRAVLDVTVAYKENVDRVIEALTDLGREMRSDPALGPYILENLEMLGVENLGESGVLIRFMLKTRPLKQWPVRREMLKRIKNRFDQLGIEIPYPHRTFIHRFPDGQAGVLPFEAEGERRAG